MGSFYYLFILNFIYFNYISTFDAKSSKSAGGN